MLEIIDHSGVLVTDSRNVALMVEKRHSDLLETINVYENYLLNGDFRSVDFFIPSTYQDATGRTLPCYLLTRKGCDMVANKMTGEKGVLFSAAYVIRFEEMEKRLAKNMTQEDIMIFQLQSMKEIKARQDEQGKEIKLINAKLENHPRDYFSIMGYASLMGFRVDNTSALRLGRKASKISRDIGASIGTVKDPRFGTVNTYHTDVLKEVFN